MYNDAETDKIKQNTNDIVYQKHVANICCTKCGKLHYVQFVARS